MGLIRLFLACVVVVDHLRSTYLPALHVSADAWIAYPELGLNAGFAVIYFFVISGFLMSYTITHNYTNDASGLVGYYRSRFIRIFSMYWPMLAITLAVFEFRPNGAASILTGIFLLGSDWYVSFASYPVQ